MNSEPKKPTGMISRIRSLLHLEEGLPIFRKHLRNGTGLYARKWELSNPNAKQKFLIWLEARRRFARKPNGVSIAMLMLVSITKDILDRFPPDALVIEGVMHEQGITFEWEEYSDLIETFCDMWEKAVAVEGTVIITALIINTGDIIEKIIRDRTMQSQTLT
jgi:hypothetical protein